MYMYLEQGESRRSEADYREEHNDERGCVENADGLGRCKFIDAFLKIEGQCIGYGSS